MDNLEKFLRENRSDLDQIEIPPINQMWGNILDEMEDEKTQNQQAKIRTLQRWFIGLAASMALVLAFGLGYFMKPNSTNLAIETTSINWENPLAKISPELKDEEEEFKRLISEKEAAVNLNSLDKEAFKEIFSELALLEKINLETQQDIPQFSDNELLVKALTRYYEQKIRILEQLMREIEHQENTRKKINEKPM